MKSPSRLINLMLMLLLAPIALALAGCASSDVNASRAKANTGYVDFYDASSADLSWEISSFDNRTGQFQRRLVDWEPPQNGIVRLAFAPGTHRLRVTYLNRAVTRPADIQVEVEVGKITPGRMNLKKAGETEVETVQASIGDTLYGTFGRRTKVTSDEELRIVSQPLRTLLCRINPKQKCPMRARSIGRDAALRRPVGAARRPYPDVCTMQIKPNQYE